MFFDLVEDVFVVGCCVDVVGVVVECVLVVDVDLWGECCVVGEGEFVLCVDVLLLG